MTTRARGVYAPLPDTPQVESPPGDFTVLWENGITADTRTSFLPWPSIAPGVGEPWSSASSGYMSAGCGSEGESFGDNGIGQHHHLTLPLECHEDDEGDSDWGEEDWPSDRPLPLPEWGCERPELRFESTKKYEEFLQPVERFLQDNVSSFTYDTLSNFIMFCREFEPQEADYSLKEFYRDYDPPLLPGRYTCVGLSADLSTRLSTLEKSYPGLKDAMYQVSSEEDVEFLQSYCESPCPPINQCEKDHVLVCVKINISGRSGVLLLDSGYHVGRPVTVMEDGLYPQTSAFVAIKKANVSKTFSYKYYSKNISYVLWDVKEYHDGKLHKSQHNLIHVTRPYLSGIDIAERRNLTYPFKSLLGRDKKGTLVAGLYFRVRCTSQCQITMFYKTEEGEVIYLKVPLAYFLYPPVIQKICDKSDEEPQPWTMQEAWEEAVSSIEDQTGNTHDLRASLSYIATMLNQQSFLQQFFDINDSINMISIAN